MSANTLATIAVAAPIYWVQLPTSNAVSYTHLSGGGKLLGKTDGAVNKDVPSGRVIGGRCVVAVSYTHLDVYKRQGPYRG